MRKVEQEVLEHLRDRQWDTVYATLTEARPGHLYFQAWKDPLYPSYNWRSWYTATHGKDTNIEKLTLSIVKL